ncbi:MAG: alanine racemase [Magnetococcales bacterium]|nr:alanine racemase [Magnetococcales bacterium]
MGLLCVRFNIVIIKIYDIMCTNRQYISEIDGVSIVDLIQLYGSPLFVTSESRLRINIRKILHSFRENYPYIVHGWPYKTNYIDAICRILHQEGSWAEVSSLLEYEKARKHGVGGEKILFNGPHKPRSILECAIAENAHLNIDHFDELKLVEAIAREKNYRISIAIRINYKSEFITTWERFGFSIDNGEARRVCNWIKKSPFLTIDGLHCHIGTSIINPDAYKEQIQIMCDFMKDIESDNETEIKFLDIGGGIPSLDAFQVLHCNEGGYLVTIDDYSKTICNALKFELSGRNKRLPTLIFECGRAVIDNSQFLITKIIGVKRLPDGKQAAILDAGINILPTALSSNHPVALSRQHSDQLIETVLYGPLCTNIDIMRQSIDLPILYKDDLLIFQMVGAYNNTNWMQFGELRPAIILISELGSHNIIRAAETVADVCRNERIPDYLLVTSPPEEGEWVADPKVRVTITDPTPSS